MHNPLFTFDLSDQGRLTIRTVCGGCEEDGVIVIPIEHLVVLTKSLMAACAEYELTLDRDDAVVVAFGSPEERRAAEARYRRYLEELRDKEKDEEPPAAASGS